MSFCKPQRRQRIFVIIVASASVATLAWACVILPAMPNREGVPMFFRYVRGSRDPFGHLVRGNKCIDPRGDTLLLDFSRNVLLIVRAEGNKPRDVSIQPAASHDGSTTITVQTASFTVFPTSNMLLVYRCDEALVGTPIEPGTADELFHFLCSDSSETGGNPRTLGIEASPQVRRNLRWIPNHRAREEKETDE